MAENYPLALQKVDAARDDFAAILDDLDFIKGQLASSPGSPRAPGPACYC
jgi:hypothetical protein